jgi:hypothetical protein
MKLEKLHVVYKLNHNQPAPNFFDAIAGLEFCLSEINLEPTYHFVEILKTRLASSPRNMAEEEIKKSRHLSSMSDAMIEQWFHCARPEEHGSGLIATVDSHDNEVST